MEKITLGKIAVALSTSIIVLPFSLAEEAKYIGEDYYGNDINAAVSEATKNKRKVNYDVKYWYNRTTSRSFNLSPLQKNELEIERLEGALEATASGGRKNIVDPEFPAENQSKQIQKDFLATKIDPETTALPTSVNNSLIEISRPLPVFELKHRHSRGDIVTTNNIITSGTVISRPRP
jgi:hypothetical protein